MKQLELSIILVNFKLKKELFDCVESIYKSSPKLNFEIIVVDNSPKDEVSKLILKQFLKVKYLHSVKNGGYSSGNNLGASIASGKYLFILNPDTQFNSGSLDSFINVYKKQKNIGVLAPVLLGRDNKPYQQGTEILTPKKAIFALSFVNKYFPKNKISRKYWNLDWDRNSLKEVDVVPGTAFLISQELFRKAGGFDENFFLYFEEFDFCLRLKKKGYKNFISPALKINHLWGASTKKSKNINSHFKKSRFYYFKKNFGYVWALIVTLFLNINSKTIMIFIILLIISLTFLQKVLNS